MMKQASSIDGFVPRRSGSVRSAAAATSNRTLGTVSATTPQLATPRRALGRSDIDDSLKSIDVEPPKDSKKAKRLGGKSKRKKIILAIVFTILAIILAIGGFLAWRFISNSSNVFQGNIFDLVQSEPLKKDANGRSNFVIFGTAEDDENGEHGGANLTDSIMVLSVSQDKKDAYMLSLPRDLWVQYEETCTVGNQGKLNAAYFCASDDGADEAAGAAALQRKVGEITGLDIQYYIHVNFTAVVDAVDAVGGVDVKIESNPVGIGIQDRNFDWKCNYRCYYVNYKDGEVAHMDGEHALAFSRARNAQGGYGLAQGNFDREKNQQKVLKALREKAVSAGTLTNLGAVTGLMDAMGKNLRTNIQTKEIRTLMDLGQKVPSDSVQQLTLVEEGNMLVTTGNVNGQSIVRPVAGLFSYSEIMAYVKKTVTADPVAKEEAQVIVLNGSGMAGRAQTEADKLEATGMVISSVGNAPAGSYGKATIYQIDSTKTASAAKLKELFGVDITSGTPPVSVTGETAFVVIIGE